MENDVLLALGGITVYLPWRFLKPQVRLECPTRSFKCSFAQCEHSLLAETTDLFILIAVIQYGDAKHVIFNSRQCFNNTGDAISMGTDLHKRAILPFS